MADVRKSRGPHPNDPTVFGPARHPVLRSATRQLGWLLGEGFNIDAAGRLVGDHHQLNKRQRMAIARAACGPELGLRRQAQTLAVAGARVVIDGFNQLVHVEAALDGGVILWCADGRTRDIASVHGTWRRIDQTGHALDLLVAALADAAEVLWILDRPISNSGRLAGMLRDRGMSVTLENAADHALAALAAEGWRLASSDGPLLDRVSESVDLAGPVVRSLREDSDPLVVNLFSGTAPWHHTAD